MAKRVFVVVLDSFGIGAEPDAMIYLGFSQDVTAAELYERCGNGTVRDVMNHVRPSAGDFFMVEPGIPHSASGKMKIAVIKESSELPFRLYDKHEQDRETLDTHLAETMDFISYGKYTVPSCRTENDSEIETIADCPEFRINRIRLTDPVHSFSEQAGSYILYICIEGEASVQIPVSDAEGRKNTENRYLKKGGKSSRRQTVNGHGKAEKCRFLHGQNPVSVLIRLRRISIDAQNETEAGKGKMNILMHAAMAVDIIFNQGIRKTDTAEQKEADESNQADSRIRNQDA